MPVILTRDQERLLKKQVTTRACLRTELCKLRPELARVIKDLSEANLWKLYQAVR
jgi:hypothetical protein